MMREALSLAENGRGKVSPNPLVGAVVVNNGKVVGKGYHDGVGKPHAEVNALSEAGNLARRAIMYVTLEPCAAWGRTPPCTDAIIGAGITKVFVGVEDPNPSVSGRGVGLLRESGIEVEVGLLEQDAKRVNEVYMKFMKTRTPFVTLKVAATIDGKIASRRGESRWITEPVARDRVQSLRRDADAILVGVGTVLADNPSLTVKDITTERQPKRIVLDSKLRTPLNAKLLDGNAPTIIATTVSPSRIVRNAEVWSFQSDSSGRVSLERLLEKAGEQGITSILVEGGAEVFSSFLSERKADKLMIFVAPKIMGSGIDAFGGFIADRLREAFQLDIADVSMVGTDILMTCYPRRDSGIRKLESD